MVSDTARRADRAAAPATPSSGISHATGRTHAAYQGSSTGDSNVNRRSPHAHCAPWTEAHTRRGGPSPRSPPHRPATWMVRRASRMNTTANAAANARRTRASTASPAPVPPSDLAASPRTTRNSRVGASHPRWVARVARPSVGSLAWKKGHPNSATSPPMTAPCAAAAWTRLPLRRHTEASTSNARGMAAGALTRAPAVRNPEARTSRFKTGSNARARPVAPSGDGGPARATTAAATARATKTSLCPLPTVSNTNAGFQATSATANGALPGHKPLAARATKRITATPAAPARTLNAHTSAATPLSTVVIPADSSVNAGP